MYLVNPVAYIILCTGALVTICYLWCFHVCICVLMSPLLGNFFKFPQVGNCDQQQVSNELTVNLKYHFPENRLSAQTFCKNNQRCDVIVLDVRVSFSVCKFRRFRTLLCHDPNFTIQNIFHSNLQPFASSSYSCFHIINTNLTNNVSFWSLLTILWQR